MQEFKVYVLDRPGELARVTEALAANAVNIRAIASESIVNQPYFRIVTNDVASTRRALASAGLKYDEEEILVAELIDRPGELAKIAGRLARAGVNISSVYMLGVRNGKSQIAMTVDNKDKARTLLQVSG